jgi:glycogen debranching enzyme
MHRPRSARLSPEIRADDRHYAEPDAEYETLITAGGPHFTYRRADWHARTEIVCRPAPDTAGVPEAEEKATTRTLTWHLPLDAHGRAELRLTVRALPHGHVSRTTAPAAERRPRGYESATAPVSDDLTRTVERGLADLDLLTVPAIGVDGEDVRVPAAGIPWFLTLCGRDSLLTSYFLLPYRPATAAAVLSALAATQGRRHDAFSGEQPARIVHETRHGELAHFRQIPYGRYYGAVDATPLFLVLLHAHHEAAGETSLAERLEQHARQAVD